ncbi:MAG: tol-pal system protein YbgF [Deltaproteobacteria bacterium]|nr:tol-pal system protein YbgF [Deltaproteobacteria bacterium]
MKKGILLGLSIMSVIMFSGCAFLDIETESQKHMKEDVKTLKTEVTETKEGAGKLMADTAADIDQLRQELASIKGRVEESEYNAARMKENLELISSTLRTLDGKVTGIESKEKELSETEGKKEMEQSVSGLKEAAEGLQHSIASIDERLKKLEGAAGKPHAENPMSLYMEGLDLVRTGKDYSKGREAFERFLSLYPDNDLSDNAQYWIGEIYYAQGDYENAALEFDKVMKKYPQGDKVAASLMKQGYSFEKLGAVKEAQILLNRVIEEFPKSSEAELAAKHLKEIEKETPKEKKK